MTTFDKQRMLSKLLLKVESKGEGFSAKLFALASKETCITVENETKRCEKAAAIRFFKYLKEQGYVGATKDGKGRCCIPQEYRENRSDAQMSWLKEVVTYNDPFKERGRIPGVSPRKKEVTPACFAEDIFNMTESDLTPAEIEETEGYVLNPETGIYEEPIIPEDSLDNYDPVTGEWKSLPGEDDVTLIGGEKYLEDSISKVMTDLGPIMERALKVGLIISVQPVIKQ